MTKNKTKNTEHEKFLKLCEYVKNEILELPEECKFPKFLALRLRGLHEGKFMANNKIKPMASYDYDIILLTFKINKFDMLLKLRQRHLFKTEKHRINYMMAIVEGKINDVVLKVKNSKKAKEHTLNVDLSIDKGADYKPKTKEINSNLLDDLW
ncbi:hypothetical protein EJM73_08665 [Clostridium botulinum]|uniref:hypothetical protein n=1 Tax=Clostridium botulinum TaxID=1491 RepID=UPI0013755968|nr:hypothetical protein [Clostridium botulinum]NCI19695.1 hypothetical protein [Clostridium botulinum]NCI35733.1 hypothetical protein [Clostridium botulinum]NCI71590.1 hypothetical protein [Clostridium botulinum]NDI38782.1 hypothetical protein [Clostridium botulinum]